MKLNDMASALRKAADDMQALAARRPNLDLPDEFVLPFITNFLTDEALGKSLH